ncbi:MAG TPA: glycosyltransferase family 2 protein [Patescibacteria group bacterium]|nr:glycosyltransferase family 2 protein [Patescibacteria group bacterium]
MSISAVVLTKNEERNIESCLKDLEFCDEIIVIDDNSTDATVELARKNGARVIVHSLENSFALQRNFGLEKAREEWVLFVDADERVSEKLKNEILEKIQNNKYVGFFLKREDVMWRKVLRHGEQGKIQLLRLAKKENGKWKGKVHEMWDIHGSVQTLDNALRHHPHPTIAEFLQEINFYSTLRSQELFENGKHANLIDILIYPKVKFIQDYFWKMGFLDGIQGFLAAILMSFHSFLVRGKLWQLQKST